MSIDYGTTRRRRVSAYVRDFDQWTPDMMCTFTVDCWINGDTVEDVVSVDVDSCSFYLTGKTQVVISDVDALATVGEWIKRHQVEDNDKLRTAIMRAVVDQDETNQLDAG